MTVDDRTRLNLHRKLTELLGPEEADTLMAHLPPVTWDRVATTDDVESLGRVLGGELRSEMRELAVQLRSEMKDVEAGIRSDMKDMEAGIRSDMKDMEIRLRSDLGELREDALVATNRQIKWLVMFAAVWSTFLLTAVGAFS